MSKARDVASSGGLVLLRTQTIGSAVSSVAVTNVFTAEYDSYKILVTGGAGSSNNLAMNFQLTGIGTGYYSNLIYANYSSGGLLTLGVNNGAAMTYFGVASVNSLNANIEVTSPFLTEETHVTGSFYDNTNTGRATGWCNSTASQTGFSLILTSGTMTGGTIRVYGYRNA